MNASWIGVGSYFAISIHLQVRPFDNVSIKTLHKENIIIILIKLFSIRIGLEYYNDVLRIIKILKYYYKDIMTW